MAPSTSILHYVQIIVAGCIVATGVVIVGIGSHLIAYTNKHRHSILPVEYKTGFYIYTVRLSYLPPHYSLARPILLLITGLICVVFNSIVAIRVIRSRKSNATAKDNKHPTFQPGIVVLAFDAFTALLTLAVTIYSWYDAHSYNPDHEWRYPLRSDAHWDSETTFDPLDWNCLLYPMIQGPNGQVRTLCYEGLALMDLTIPLLLLTSAMLCIHFWIWRGVKKTMSGNVGLTDGRSDSYQMDDYQGLITKPDDHKVYIP